MGGTQPEPPDKDFDSEVGGFGVLLAVSQIEGQSNAEHESAKHGAQLREDFSADLSDLFGDKLWCDTKVV